MNMCAKVVWMGSGLVMENVIVKFSEACYNMLPANWNFVQVVGVQQSLAL